MKAIKVHRGIPNIVGIMILNSLSGIIPTPHAVPVHHFLHLGQVTDGGRNIRAEGALELIQARRVGRRAIHEPWVGGIHCHARHPHLSEHHCLAYCQRSPCFPLAVAGHPNCKASLFRGGQGCGRVEEDDPKVVVEERGGWREGKSGEDSTAFAGRPRDHHAHTINNVAIGYSAAFCEGEEVVIHSGHQISGKLLP